jgi:hypothetical protein
MTEMNEPRANDGTSSLHVGHISQRLANTDIKDFRDTGRAINDFARKRGRQNEGDTIKDGTRSETVHSHPALE